MPVEATGLISQPIDLARELLAACAAFQAWCGVAEGEPAERQAQALERCHRFWLEENPAGETLIQRQARRPFAAVGYGMDFRAERTLGICMAPKTSVSVSVLFEATPDSEQTEKEQFIQFGNDLWTILSALYAAENAKNIRSIAYAPGGQPQRNVEWFEKPDDGIPLVLFQACLEIFLGGAGL